MTRMGRGIKRLLQRFRRSQRGNVAMMAGIALPVLLMISAGAIDLHHIAKVRSELQDALDAATLAAARSNSATPSEIQSIGMASLRANMPQYFGAGSPDVANFTLNSRYEVEAAATVQVKTIVANVFLPPYGKLFDDYMPMSANSQVLRASRNVELAMALDVTGSMSGSKLADLKDAAIELVDIVIQGNQEVFTTRIALVPYARGVNMGTYADAVRGQLRASTTIREATWANDPVSIDGASNGNFTASSNPPKKDDYVFLTGFSTSSLNNSIRKVSSVSGNTFTLSGLSGTYYAATNGTRRFRICHRSDCSINVVSDGHGLSTGEVVKISNVRGMTTLNGTFSVTVPDANNFIVSPSPQNHSAYTSGGEVQCGSDGCALRIFQNRNNSQRELVGSTCVSERPRGSAAPRETAPNSSNYVGRAYMPNSTGMTNGCQPATFLPLTNVASDLKTRIRSYTAAGATAGQVGIEMAWYAISPVFSPVFNNSSTPLIDDSANPYDAQKTIKAVVLMTDGEFNTPFCQGVVARDAGSGSISEDYRINCNSVNGDSFAQSIAICNAMKSKGIVVYTVAFDLSSASNATNVMRNCASSADNFHDTKNGTDLKEAFKQIGRDITRLRIAR